MSEQGQLSELAGVVLRASRGGYAQKSLLTSFVANFVSTKFSHYIWMNRQILKGTDWCSDRFGKEQMDGQTDLERGNQMRALSCITATDKCLEPAD